MAPTIYFSRMSMSHSPRPPHLERSGSVTLEVLQRCLQDTLPSISAQTACAAKHVEAFGLQLLVQSMPMFSFGRGSVSVDVAKR